MLDREKAARARKVARRRHLRTVAGRLRPPRRGRTGTVRRFSRAERTGLIVVPLVAATAVWFLIPEIGLRILLIALILIALPALTAVTIGRR